MKIFIHIVIFIFLISLVFYLYNLQLGAIPFLLMSIYFFIMAVSISSFRLGRNRFKQRKTEGKKKGQKVRENT